jgi:hypothetical protein
MSAARSMTIRFPLGGENRRGKYSQHEEPYTTPRAVNMRSIGPLERRGRGGSRPGLARFIDECLGEKITAMSSVTYLDNNGTRRHDIAVIVDGVFKIIDNGGTAFTLSAALLTPDGVPVLDDDGNEIIFNSTIGNVNPVGDTSAFQLAQNNGRLYIADDVLKVYNPRTGIVGAVEVTAGIIPAGQPLICVYQERLVVAGADHMFYMSAQADAGNWDAGADGKNPGRAVFGYVGDNGVIGEPITSMLCWHDKALLLGTMDSLWAVYGNPAANGHKENVSSFVGVLGPRAMCATPGGQVLFLGRNGLNVWRIGSKDHPEPFSALVVPEDLLDVDPQSTEVWMHYDHRSRGAYLFLTPRDGGTGQHWWIDLEHRALWPFEIPAECQPAAAADITAGGFTNALLACRDGYLRRFDADADTDDGTPVSSDLLLGPFHISGNDAYDGQIAELVSALSSRGDVAWELFTGRTAEEAADSADDAVRGRAGATADSAGVWRDGFNRPSYPRSRGPWIVLRMHSESQWSYETVTLFAKRLGRLR